MEILQFNGSYLGHCTYEDTVKSIKPITNPKYGVPVFKAIVIWQGVKYPVYIKKCYNNKKDQLVIDELKPLFGLQKMGTHMITLDVSFRKIIDSKPWDRNYTVYKRKSEYFLFRANVHPDGSFRRYETVDRIESIMEYLTTQIVRKDTPYDEYLQKIIKQIEVKKEIGKIFLFRELFRVDHVRYSDILYIPESHGYMSIDECHIRDRDKKVVKSKDKDKGKDKGIDILISMLGLTENIYKDRLAYLRCEIYDIIMRVEPELAWLSDYVYTVMYNMMDIYYT